MSILTVEHLTHGFGDRAIFHDVSFRLLKGEHIGLVGANGEGKSTFMNIITGKLQPDEGRIEWAKNVRVGYLDQHTALEKGMTIRDVLASAFEFLFTLEAQMNEMYEKMAEASDEEMAYYMEETGVIQELLSAHDFYLIDAKVEEVGRALGLAEVGLDRDVSELSGGQRTRVLLGKLLLEKPDILLLDEPTNYMDEVHIEWLKRYLNDYENAFILISHDIPFLNSVINLVYHMDNQELNRYVGDYDRFQEVYAVKKAQLEAAYNRQQKEIAELKDYVARNIVRATTASSAQSRVKKLENMELLEKPLPPPAPPVFRFATDAESEERTLEVRHLRLFAGERELFGDVEFTLRRGEKVALLGENGAGKSTLARALADGRDPAVRWGRFVKLGYYDQENAALDPDETVLGALWNKHRGMSQTQARALLAQAKLGEEDVDKKVRSLSGGERAKLALVLLEAERANVLILDEPTNHLDLQAREALETALKAFRGTLLFVSHDRYFTAALAEKVLDAADGRITPYPCGYTEYAEQKMRAAQQAAAAANAKKAEERAKQGAAAHRTKAERAEEAKRKQRVKELETRIAALEAEEAALQAAIADPAVAADYKALGDACARLETLHAALDSLYADYEKMI